MIKRRSSGQGRCYFCGAPADAPNDHVPPEVFFRGANEAYKTPTVISVPSCERHNGGTSQDDEACAWIIADAAAKWSPVAFDVLQRLCEPLRPRVMRDPAFVDKRLALLGMRIPRKRASFGDDLLPKSPFESGDYAMNAERRLRDSWAIVKRTMQKIAAGLFFHRHGVCLGPVRIANIHVHIPGFKQVEPEVRLVPVPIDEASFFRWPKSAGAPSWTATISGDERVFLCEQVSDDQARRFRMKLRFYERLFVWIRCDG